MRPNPQKTIVPKGKLPVIILATDNILLKRHIRGQLESCCCRIRPRQHDRIGNGPIDLQCVGIQPPETLHKGMALRVTEGVTSRDADGTEFVSYRFAAAEPAHA